MAEHKNITKLRAARVMPYVYGTTLAQQGYEGLQQLVSAKEYEVDGKLLSYFLSAGSTYKQDQARQAVYVAHLFAKHLCLSGAPVFCTSVAGIIYTLSEPADLAAKWTLGKGYIVVTDLMLEEDASSVWSKKELRLVSNILMDHVYEGGALVVTGRSKGTTVFDTQSFGVGFQSFLNEYFIYHSTEKAVRHV